MGCFSASLPYHITSMDGVSEKFVIRLMVGRQIYPITIKRDQEELYRKAALVINDKLKRYEQTYPNLDYDRYMPAVLLDFAVSTLQLRQQKDQSPYADTVKRLSEELTQLLDSKNDEEGLPASPNP